MRGIIKYSHVSLIDDRRRLLELYRLSRVTDIYLFDAHHGGLSAWRIIQWSLGSRDAHIRSIDRAGSLRSVQERLSNSRNFAIARLDTQRYFALSRRSWPDRFSSPWRSCSAAMSSSRWRESPFTGSCDDNCWWTRNDGPWAATYS